MASKTDRDRRRVGHIGYFHVVAATSALARSPLEIVLEEIAGAAAHFARVVRPKAAAPISVAASLSRKQIE